MIHLALKLFARDWRSGALTLLTLSLLVGISTMTSISLFTDRMKHSMLEQASEVLAADVQVRGSSAPDFTWVEQAKEQGLTTAMSVSISVMAFAGDNMTLSAVKAVSSSYPLKGQLEISDTAFGVGRVVREGPKLGEVWINSSLFSTLNIQVGDLIDVGDLSLRVSAALIKEPDVSMGAMFSGARIIMNDGDLLGTGVIQPGSRVQYHWMLAGPKNRILAFKHWLKPNLDIHHWWVDAQDSSNNLSNTMDRAQSFLLLAGCLSVILAGIAVALAARRYVFKQRITIALLKTLGMTPQKITSMYAYYLLLLGAITSFVGMILGWLIHWGVLYFIRDMLPVELQPASAKAYWSGAVVGYLALFAFAGPPLFVLRFIPPIVVIRDTFSKNNLMMMANIAIGFLSILLLVYWYSQSVMISVIFLGSLLACGVCTSCLAWCLVYVSKVISKNMSGYWRLGFTNLYRHRQYNTLQLMIFTILLMLLFSLYLVRTSLISGWQNSMQENAPNYFVYNIFSDEKNSLEEYLRENGVQSQAFHPIVQGRISAVNGHKFTWLQGDPNQQNRYVRELGLTWSDEAASHSVIEGVWWDKLEKSESMLNNFVSIEKSFADGMNLHVGDNITMSIAGEEFTTQVSSIRRVDWASTTPNFFMIFQYPISFGVEANWVTSFYIPPSDISLVNQLARKYPTVTLLAVEQILQQIKTIITQVTLAVEFILVLVLIAGLLVLVTGVQATLDERLKESAILRTLGASRQLVHRSLLIEFSSLGFVAGLFAAIGAELCLFMLQSRLFSMGFAMDGFMLLLGPLIGLCLIGCIGWLSTMSVTQTPPLVILRALDSRA